MSEPSLENSNLLTEDELEDLKGELDLEEDNKSLYFEGEEGKTYHFSKSLSEQEIRESVAEKREELEE